MLGLIAGDIIGSIREGRKSLFNERGLIYATKKNGTVTQLDKPEPIIHEGLSFTDDTVLAMATDKAIRNKTSFADAYCNFFDIHSNQSKLYRGPGIGYGVMFLGWAHSNLTGEKKGPYGSYGNGSGMRVPPVAYHAGNLFDLMNMARNSAECTHNHPEGIKGAQAVALAVWLARAGMTSPEIKSALRASVDYELEFDEGKLVRDYVFSPTCRGSVPHAIWAALEGPDFESVMIRCLKVGGDTDTIAAMAGAIAEPLYGLPDHIAKPTLAILERDGPFLFEEYKTMLERCEQYTNYFKTSGVHEAVKSPGVLMKKLKALFRLD